MAAPRKRMPCTPLACEGCRKRKSKCDGGQPCALCAKKNETCEYIFPKSTGEQQQQYSPNLQNALVLRDPRMYDESGRRAGPGSVASATAAAVAAAGAITGGSSSGGNKRKFNDAAGGGGGGVVAQKPRRGVLAEVPVQGVGSIGACHYLYQAALEFCPEEEKETVMAYNRGTKLMEHCVRSVNCYYAHLDPLFPIIPKDELESKRYSEASPTADPEAFAVWLGVILLGSTHCGGQELPPYFVTVLRNVIKEIFDRVSLEQKRALLLLGMLEHLLGDDESARIHIEMVLVGNITLPTYLRLSALLILRFTTIGQGDIRSDAVFLSDPRIDGADLRLVKRLQFLEKINVVAFNLAAIDRDTAAENSARQQNLPLSRERVFDIDARKSISEEDADSLLQVLSRAEGIMMEPGSGDTHGITHSFFSSCLNSIRSSICVRAKYYDDAVQWASKVLSLPEDDKSNLIKIPCFLLIVAIAADVILMLGSHDLKVQFVTLLRRAPIDFRKSDRIAKALDTSRQEEPHLIIASASVDGDSHHSSSVSSHGHHHSFSTTPLQTAKTPITTPSNPPTKGSNGKNAAKKNGKKGAAAAAVATTATSAATVSKTPRGSSTPKVVPNESFDNYARDFSGPFHSVLHQMFNQVTGANETLSLLGGTSKSSTSSDSVASIHSININNGASSVQPPTQPTSVPLASASSAAAASAAISAAAVAAAAATPAKDMSSSSSSVPLPHRHPLNAMPPFFDHGYSTHSNNNSTSASNNAALFNFTLNSLTPNHFVQLQHALAATTSGTRSTGDAYDFGLMSPVTFNHEEFFPAGDDHHHAHSR